MLAKQPALSSNVLDMEDLERRQQRARAHVIMGPSNTRRFGYYRTESKPNEPELVCQSRHPAEDRELIEALKEIEKYAGYIVYERSMYCIRCRGNCRVGYREFAFRPLNRGFLYRWPEGLQHYFQYHTAQVPQWMRELVLDFNRAKREGVWR